MLFHQDQLVGLLKPAPKQGSTAKGRWGEMTLDLVAPLEPAALTALAGALAQYQPGTPGHTPRLSRIDAKTPQHWLQNNITEAPLAVQLCRALVEAGFRVTAGGLDWPIEPPQDNTEHHPVPTVS